MNAPDTEAHRLVEVILQEQLSTDKSPRWQVEKLFKIQQTLDRLKAIIAQMQVEAEKKTIQEKIDALLLRLQNAKENNDMAESKNINKAIGELRGYFYTSTRRSFITVLSLGLVGAALAPKELFANTAETEQNIRDRWEKKLYYLQFGALRTLTEATAEVKRLHIINLRIYPAASGTFRYKVLYFKPFRNEDEAATELRRIGAKVEAAGVIYLNEDGTPEWKETVEDKIVKEVKRITPKECSTKDYHHFIVEAVNRYPLKWQKEEAIRILHCIIMHESGGNPNARGPTGDFGLMQIVHTAAWSTWRAFHLKRSRRYHTRENIPHSCNILDPEQNIDCGVAFLSYLCERNPGASTITILRMYNAKEEDVLNNTVRNEGYARSVLAYKDQF